MVDLRVSVFLFLILLLLPGLVVPKRALLGMEPAWVSESQESSGAGRHLTVAATNSTGERRSCDILGLQNTPDHAGQYYIHC